MLPNLPSAALDQKGLTLTYQHSFDARTAFDAAATYGVTDSPARGYRTNVLFLRAGVQTRLTSDTTAFAGVRRDTQQAEGNAAEYTANMLYGALDIRF